MVDDFGISTLIRTMRTTYYKPYKPNTSSPPTGTDSCTNCLARTVQLSKPGYIGAALVKFQQTPLQKPQHAPPTWIWPGYGTTAPALLLDAKAITRLQQRVKTLLYYSRAVDSTILVALGSLAEAQKRHKQHRTGRTAALRLHCHAS